MPPEGHNVDAGKHELIQYTGRGYPIAEKRAAADTSLADPEITTMQIQFLAMRPAYPTDADAARALGIHTATPANWKANCPEFARRYANIAQDALEMGRERLRSALGAAIDTLEQELQGSNARNRLRAAELIIAYAGMTRGSSLEVTITDKTRLLLEAIRQARDDADVVDGEVMSSESGETT